METNRPNRPVRILVRSKRRPDAHHRRAGDRGRDRRRHSGLASAEGHQQTRISHRGTLAELLRDAPAPVLAGRRVNQRTAVDGFARYQRASGRAHRDRPARRPSPRGNFQTSPGLVASRAGRNAGRRDRDREEGAESGAGAADTPNGCRSSPDAPPRSRSDRAVREAQAGYSRLRSAQDRWARPCAIRSQTRPADRRPT